MKNGPIEPLDRYARRILERFLFTGETCFEVAEALEMAVDDVRQAAISGIRSLYEATTSHVPAPGENEALVALYAIGALDPEEADAVRRAISGSLVLARQYYADRDLLAAACTTRSIEPPPHLYRRLVSSIEAAGPLTGRA